MAYVDVVLIPVAEANRPAYEAEVRRLADLFRDCGATEVVDAWESDVPEGEMTSLPLAVARQAGEKVAFGWVLWPDKAARDAGWDKALADPRMSTPETSAYDPRRMIFGGFEVIHAARDGG